MKQELLAKLNDFWNGELPESRDLFFSTRDNPCSITLLKRIYGHYSSGVLWKKLNQDWVEYVHKEEAPSNTDNKDNTPVVNNTKGK